MASQRFRIIKAYTSHIRQMVELSYQKRKSYEQVQPRFWKEAQGSNKLQEDWFGELLGKESYLIWVACSEVADTLQGFIIGSLIEAPGVYDPGGKTLMIDDFCVDEPSLWEDVGRELLARVEGEAAGRGVIQTVVVSGEHDEFKKAFLESQGLQSASRWYVSEIRSQRSQKDVGV